MKASTAGVTLREILAKARTGAAGRVAAAAWLESQPPFVLQDQNASLSARFRSYLRTRLLELLPTEAYYERKGPWSMSKVETGLAHISIPDRVKWIDHWRVGVHEGVEFFASEPYLVATSPSEARSRMEAVAGALTVALDLPVTYQRNSQHNPPDCIRYTIWGDGV